MSVQRVAGERFGPYEIEAEIGRGGQAVVYRARQRGTERSVALKVFDAAENAAALARFRQEAVAAARVENPRIVTVYESGDVDGVPFLAMRLVPGPSLAEVIARFGAVPPARALAILSDVAEAVDAAHAAGLVHRDIKPANVLLDLDERAFLSDFGVARIEDRPGLTRRGDWLGTVEYVSPEQAEGRPVTSASDVYAFGVLAYEVLTGRPPFLHRQPSAVLVAHVREDPPPVAAFNPGLPAGLDAVLARPLAKSPSRRPAHAAEVVAALRRVLADAAEVPGATRVAARPEPDAWTTVMRRFSGGGQAATRVRPAAPGRRPPRRTRRRSLVAAGAATVLLLSGGAAAAGWIASDRATGDVEDARATAYQNGFRNGRVRGVEIGVRTGEQRGRAAGLEQGRREGYASGLAEGRRVPDASPGQYRIVRVSDDGAGEFVGPALDGGCFRIDGDGEVTDISTPNPFSICSTLVSR